MRSAAPIAAVRLKRAIRLLKKQRRAGVKRERSGPPAVDARRFVWPRPCRLGRSLLASKADGRERTRERGARKTWFRLARLDCLPGAGAGRCYCRRGHLPRGARSGPGLRGLPAPAPACCRIVRVLADRIRGRSAAARTGRRRRLDRSRSSPPPPRPRSARLAPFAIPVRPSPRSPASPPASEAMRAPRRISGTSTLFRSSTAGAPGGVPPGVRQRIAGTRGLHAATATDRPNRWGTALERGWRSDARSEA